MNEAEISRGMSNFTFMAEWPELQEPAGKAELLAQADPRAACFYARFAMERAVQWVYRFEPAMRSPGYDDTLNTPIDHFTQNGVMEPQHLAQPPFSDIHSDSLFGLFDQAQVELPRR